MDDPVSSVRRGVAAGKWDAVRLALHPYLHWTDPGGAVLRGRRNVLARLAAGPVPPPPASIELRDGQIYRWTS